MKKPKNKHRYMTAKCKKNLAINNSIINCSFGYYGDEKAKNPMWNNFKLLLKKIFWRK